LFWSAAIRAQLQNEQDKSIIAYLSDLLIERSSPFEAIRWRELKAAALTEVNNHVKAEEELSQALKTFPDSPDLRMSRGYMYMLNNKIPESIEDFDFIIKVDPRSSLAYLNKSISEGILGNYKEASSSAQAAIDNIVPGTYGSLSETAVCPEVSNTTGYQTIVASENAFAVALHYQLANIKAFQGADFAEEMKSAGGTKGKSHDRNAYLSAINWAWLHMRNRKEDYGGYASQGAMWEELGSDYCHQALGAYNEFQRRYKEKPDSRYGKLAEWVNQKQRVATRHCRIPQLDKEDDAQTLAAQAESSISRGDLADAHDKLTRAINLDPKNIYLLATRASVNNRLRYFDKSRNDAAEVLKLAGGKPVPRASLLVALATTDDASREQILRSIVKDYPNHTEALSRLSKHLEEKNPAEAIALLKRLTELNPFDDELFSNKAELEFKNKRYQDALDSNKKAIAINRDRPNYYTQRMEIERKLATTPEDIERSKAVGFDDLAELMVRRGLPQLALTNYETSLKSLASIARSKSDSGLKIDMTVTMDKMIRLIEQQETRVKAVEMMEQMKREFADFEDLRTLLDSRIKHLSTL
jgi:tetratricopeptide (TPR) repeat protein